MNPAREQIEYRLTQLYFWILRRCPQRVLLGTCHAIARVFYALAAKRRYITRANLQIAFPEKTESERAQIARTAYRHFGTLIAESAMVLAGKLTREMLLERVDGRAMQTLLDLEASTDQGILFITGHLGNFELLAHYTGMRFERVGHVVARRGNNRLIDERIVTPMRESFGNHVIYKNRALPRIARALKRGEHAGLLIDIKTNAKQGVPVRFFGRETLGIKSSAYLQLKFQPLVVPMAMLRDESGKLRLVVRDPIEWSDNGRPFEEQLAELTQRHQSELEALIRMAPEQWFWMHNRWRLS